MLGTKADLTCQHRPLNAAFLFACVNSFPVPTENTACPEAWGLPFPRPMECSGIRYCVIGLGTSRISNSLGQSLPVTNRRFLAGS